MYNKYICGIVQYLIKDNKIIRIIILFVCVKFQLIVQMTY